VTSEDSWGSRLPLQSGPCRWFGREWGEVDDGMRCACSNWMSVRTMGNHRFPYFSNPAAPPLMLENLNFGYFAHDYNDIIPEVGKMR